MKTRNGFVSNSSSSSFIVDLSNIPEELKSKVMRLTDRSDDSTRCTGIITNLKQWIEEIGEDYYNISKYIDNPNIVIIRESDEQMGGEFDDYGFCEDDIKKYVIGEFEYH
jgi:hypothetical protein